MKKALALFGGTSVAAFVAIFLQVAHFGRNQVLLGDGEDVETAASATLFAVVKFVFTLLHDVAVLLRDHGLLIVVFLTALATVGIFLSRPHFLDASLLAGLIVAGVAVFWFLAAPWLFVSRIIQDRGLHPNELIRGTDRMSASARENWSCLVCASVRETRFRDLVCGGKGHDPDSCAGHIQRRFSAMAGATLLLVGLLAYVVLARGSWIDRASPGSGFTKATLAALSVVCITVVALDVYAVGYVYGKTAFGFDLQKARKVQSEFVSDPFFVVAQTSSRATLLLAKGRSDDVQLDAKLALKPTEKANVLTEFLTALAEAELQMKEDNTFFGSK